MALMQSLLFVSQFTQFPSFSPHIEIQHSSSTYRPARPIARRAVAAAVRRAQTREIAGSESTDNAHLQIDSRRLIALPVIEPRVASLELGASLT
jgi:hypothetical protein